MARKHRIGILHQQSMDGGASPPTILEVGYESFIEEKKKHQYLVDFQKIVDRYSYLKLRVISPKLVQFYGRCGNCPDILPYGCQCQRVVQGVSIVVVLSGLLDSGDKSSGSEGKGFSQPMLPFI